MSQAPGWWPSVFVTGIVLCGCSSSKDMPDAAPFIDLTDVEPLFAPTKQTVGAALQISYKTPYGADRESTAMREFLQRRLGDIGITENRRDILWNDVEPARGEIDFSEYDRVVSAGLEQGVATLPLLVYGNAWAVKGSDDDRRPPDDLSDFSRYVAATVEQYRDSAPAYEVWNEPNLGLAFWHPREDADHYGALFKGASQVIRERHPDATVVLGGLLYHQTTNSGAEIFLEDLFLAHRDIADHFDAVSIHPYKLYPPQSAPESESAVDGELSMALMMARTRALLSHFGVSPDVPIWVTEIGYATFQLSDRGVTEEQQARWLIRSVMLLMGAGADRVYWFTLADGADHLAYPPEGSFGLWRWDDPADGYDPEPKAAWHALATLRSIAGDLVITADIAGEIAGAPQDLWAYRLESSDGDRRVTVVWRANDEAEPATVMVPVRPGATVKVLNMFGEDLGASAEVSVSGRPVFVEEQ